VAAADVGGGVLGLGVVAQAHERGGAAAQQADGVAAQVAEEQGERNAGQLAGVREPLGVGAGHLVGAREDDRGHGLPGRGRRHLDGQPLHQQAGEHLAGRAARRRVHDKAGEPGGLGRPPFGRVGGQAGQGRVEAGQAGHDLVAVPGGEQAAGDALGFDVVYGHRD
jgi:hypothetical protein